MYIISIIAQIKVVIIVVAIFAFSIIPLIINLECKFKSNKKEIFFCVKLFWLFTIIKGTLHFTNEGIIIYFRKKTKVITYGSLLNVGEKIKPLKDYHVLSFDSLIEIGYIDDLLIECLCLTKILNYFTNLITHYLLVNKPFIKLNNQINVYEGDKRLNVYIKTKSIINVVTVLIGLVKLLWRFINEKRKSRNKNKQCDRKCA